MNQLQNDLNRFALNNVLRLCVEHDMCGLDVLIYNRLVLKEYIIYGESNVQNKE